MGNLLFRLPSRALAALAATLSALVIAGCGGAGAGAGGTATGSTSGSGQVADIILFTDKATLPAPDGSTFATITAQVKDGQNNVLRNQGVTFTTADTGVALAPVGTNNLTDASGRMSVRVELGSGAGARTNRAVPVIATAGGVSRTMNVQVAGTKLTISGPDTVAAGASADYTIAAVDAANVGVLDVPVTLTFDKGSVTPAAATTAANGQITVRVTAAAGSSGAGTLTASALGLAPTKAINVLGSDTPFQIVAPSDNATVNVNTDQTVRVRFSRAGSTASGRTVTITATRGLFGSSSTTTVTTDANGEAVATIRSASAGASTLTAIIQADPATGEMLTTSSRLAFASRTAAKIALSPDPTSIGANAIGSSSSTSRLIATVRDASDNPVSGARVAFSAVDPSGGRIEPGVAVTDVDGQASASFIAGPNSTGPNEVVVRASVLESPSVQDERRMTVSAVALFIELGTGNSIEPVDTTTYRMPWSAIVTDANRNPVVGARVTVSLTAVRYYKGIWVWQSTAWVPSIWNNVYDDPVPCLSEDGTRDLLGNLIVAPNNLLDAGEDKNGNGRLDPGSPAAAVLTSANGVTDANGVALISVVYPKSFGLWVDMRMRVTIATSGTESSVSREFLLPALAADVTNQTTAPPNVNARLPADLALPPGTPSRALIGPYGYETARDAQGYCTNPN